jgi:predicted permease
MFALADPFLLRPLPYAQPDRLVVVRAALAPSLDGAPAVVPRIDDWRARRELFDAVAAHGEFAEYRLQGPSGALLFRTIPVSRNFFDVLGVPFRASGPWEEAEPGSGARSLLLLEGPKAASLGGAASEGRTFPIEGGRSIEIAGITPEGFLFPVSRASRRPDAVTPVRFGETILVSPGRTSYVTGIARLAAGVSPAAAQSALAGAAGPGIALTVQPLEQFMTTSLRPLALGALLAGLLITLACAANVVNLMVARGIYRTREFATREAIGARARDLLRLVAVEIAAITAVAIAASLLFAHFALRLVAQVIPIDYTYLGAASVTPRVALFTAALGTAVVLAGFAGVWLTRLGARDAGINSSLAAEARKVRWTRFSMVAGQAATAMILLVGGVFLVRSYVNLWSQQTGFSHESAIVSVLYPPGLPHTRVAEEIHATVDRLKRVPGIVAVAATTGPLLDDATVVGGSLMRVGDKRLLFGAKQVTPDYLDAVGAAPVAGRFLQAGDRNWSGVAVNEAFVRRFWPGRPLESAVGEIITLQGNSRLQGRIVGIVPNTHDRALDRPPAPAMYRLLESTGGILPHHFIVKLRDRSRRPDAAVQQAVAAVSRDAVIVDAAWLDERLAGTVRDRSFATLILSLFAAAGLGVTASGLFGVVAFAVARRTREIAIRRAVGADGRDIVRLVVREAAAAAAVGALAGIVAGRWLSRFLASYMFGVTSADVGSLSLVAVLMIGVVVAAAWMPTRRALGLSPTQALRVE